MATNNTTQIENARPQTLSELKDTLTSFVERVNNTAYEGTLIEHVYFLCGGDKLRDNLYCYNQACIGLLAALAKPKISNEVEKIIGDYYYDYLVDFLGNIIKFTEQMNSDRFTAEMHLFQIEEYSNSFTQKHADFLLKEYKTKFLGLRGEKV